MDATIRPPFDPHDKRDYLCLMWNLTRACGAKCDYCPFHNDESVFLNKKQTEQILYWIKNNFPKRKYNQITIFGGEPTKSYRFTAVVRDLAKMYHYRDYQGEIVIYTNFTGKLDQYYEALSSPHVRLIVTYHPQLWNTPGKHPDLINMFDTGATRIDKFKKKLFQISQYKRQIQINLMSSEMEEMTLKEQLTLNHWTVETFIPHRKEHKAQGHHDHQHGAVHAHNGIHVVDVKGWKGLVNQGANCFTGWRCLAGKNNLYIEENGDVYPCQGIGQAAYLKKPNALPRITNLLHDTEWKYDWDNAPMTTCPQKSCRFELYISKIPPRRDM